MKVILLLFLLIFSTTTYSRSNYKLIRQYKVFKEVAKCSFLITSSRRSKAKNKAVGGAKHSHHLKGMAYDLVPLSSCKKSHYQLGVIAQNYFKGVIIYKSHIHVDVGNRTYFKVDLRGRK